VKEVLENRLTKLISIDYPIIQAPMAGGVTTSNFVASVSNSGGLGMIGAGYMSPAQLQTQIREVKKLTSNKFGINLFIPQEFNRLETELQEANKLLQPIKDLFNLPNNQLKLPTAESERKVFYEQIKVVIEEKVPVCSFTFGVPSKEVTAELKENKIILIGTATNVKEAIINEEIGMDAVVVQGSEAGGHRGSFASDEGDSMMGLMSLIPQAVGCVKIPVIAAGGIMDGKGLQASICLGAEGVQMGTAFLTCIESGAHPLHKEAILNSVEDQTVVTRVYSGKWARGIQNKLYKDLKIHENKLPSFPIQNTLTSSIRKAASTNNNLEYMSLWAGQGASLARNITVDELMKMTISEAESLMLKGTFKKSET
jgi:nitronate monooxygenase